MRIGVIGGTFDPPHLGHLIVAQETHLRLDLERVVFVPAGQPPHKRNQAITDADHRVAMVELAIAGDTRFALSRVDVERPGPCYSVDTVRLLHEAWGEDAAIHFIIGSDSLRDLPKWYQPQRLLRMCQVIAVDRPGYPTDLAKIDRDLPGVAGLIERIEIPTVDISSTQIRERVTNGWPIRYLVRDPVARYVQEHHLYACQTDP
jgi:nicotinate-nucleotide adenylyltransferase